MAVLISHRFCTVRMADRILVLRGGELVEQGTHEALVAQGGLYAELFQLQAAGYRVEVERSRAVLAASRRARALTNPAFDNSPRPPWKFQHSQGGGGHEGLWLQRHPQRGVRRPRGQRQDVARRRPRLGVRIQPAPRQHQRRHHPHRLLPRRNRPAALDQPRPRLRRVDGYQAQPHRHPGLPRLLRRSRHRPARRRRRRGRGERHRRGGGGHRDAPGRSSTSCTCPGSCSSRSWTRSTRTSSGSSPT